MATSKISQPKLDEMCELFAIQYMYPAIDQSLKHFLLTLRATIPEKIVDDLNDIILKMMKPDIIHLMDNDGDASDGIRCGWKAMKLANSILRYVIKNGKVTDEYIKELSEIAQPYYTFSNQIKK